MRMHNFTRYLYYIIFSLLLFNTEPVFPQLDIDWKEMASLDYYQYKGPVFWNYYSTLNTEYKKNIIRAKKLGCNMVRIPLNFIPKDYDPSAPKYDHGWVDPSEVGSGKVFRSTQYLSDIKDMIKFCRDNGMKVNLILFNHGLSSKNCAGFHNPAGTKYESYYTPKGTDPNWIDLSEMNLWFKDAAAWIDKILTAINLKDIEVFEIRNEAYPNYAADKTYPDYFYDIFLLEMTGYIRNKYPEKDLMISVTQIDNRIKFSNLQRMLKNAEKNIFRRPGEISFSNHNVNSLFFFEYFSFHNYNTYSYRKSFQDILDLGRLQKNNYSWHFGEIGYDMAKSSETDQAKNYLSNFQIIAEFHKNLRNSGTPVKGIGIWSIFDYVYNAEPGTSHGVTDFSNITSPRKRKAAYIIENFFEGLVDNPDFEIEIGPYGAEPNFNDSKLFNGWAPWWEGSGDLSSSISLISSAGNNMIRVKAKTDRKLGLSSSPGRRIYVKPGSRVSLSSVVSIKGSIGSGKIFPLIKWYDANGITTGDTRENNVERSGSQFRINVSVPQNAVSAELYLMVWNVPDGVLVDFDNVRYVPEEIPLIELISMDDQSSGGWRQNDVSKVEVTFKNFRLKSGAEINSTRSINVNQTTAIRIRPDREYSVSAVVKSSDAVIELGFAEPDQNDFPLKEKKEVEIPVKHNDFKTVESKSVKSAGNKWLNIKIHSSSDSTELKSFIIFERNPDFI